VVRELPQGLLRLPEVRPAQRLQQVLQEQARVAAAG